MIWYMGQRNKTRALKHKKFKALGEVSCLIRILEQMKTGPKLEVDIEPHSLDTNAVKSNDMYFEQKQLRSENQSARKPKYVKPK